MDATSYSPKHFKNLIATKVPDASRCIYGLGYTFFQQVSPFLSPVAGHVLFFLSPHLQCFVGATDSTASVLYHTCHCSGVILLIDACARRVKESEMDLGVREDEDVDGYAIKTILHPVFLMTKSLQLLVYCPPRSLTPSPAPLVLRSCVLPTHALHRHLAETWMTTPFPNIQNAA
jgi:hypothetical protein